MRNLNQTSALEHPDAARMFSVTPLVALLLGACCPSAIRRFVVAIIVDPIQRMIRRRAAAHVGEERFVGSHPSVTNDNPAPAVTGIPLVVRVNTALSHVYPRVILGRPRTRPRVPVCRLGSAALIAMVAAATQRLASSQIRPFHNSLGTTVTATEEIRPRPLVGSEQHEQASDALPRVVAERHPLILLQECHVT